MFLAKVLLVLILFQCGDITKYTGSYAKVREAIDSITNRKVAIKILSKRKLKKMPGGESAVKKEVEVLSKLRHVNIVEHIDYFTIEEKEKMYP